ncbi:MAG: sulfurtransferase TusA family protein [Chloroflexi bacterium]|nr:sulfurtransferase TusA family protein [Chloroflexota bacterium]
MKADQTLDCLGFYCPIPIVKTAARIKELKTGEVLEVISDDKGIKLDMPAWCKTTGHECLGMDEQNGEFRVYVKKTHD